MRRAEGAHAEGRGHEAPGREALERGGFEGLVLRHGWKDARQALREHRLARARRTGEEKTVPTGRGEEIMEELIPASEYEPVPSSAINDMPL